MAKKNNIVTTNEELYNKFLMLNIKPTVVIKNQKFSQVKRLVDKVNKKGDVVSIESKSKKLNNVTIKKINPINFNIYKKQKKSVNKW